jgi:hypothetical protein
MLDGWFQTLMIALAALILVLLLICLIPCCCPNSRLGRCFAPCSCCGPDPDFFPKIDNNGKQKKNHKHYEKMEEEEEEETIEDEDAEGETESG